jgi:hypothetical protein
VNYKVGEPFNPHRAFLGIFIPLGLLSYRGISDSAKLLYGRLCMFAGKDGLCIPSIETLSVAFGCHPNVISRWMGELVEQGFIRRLRHGPGKNASCEFLWHLALATCLRGDTDSSKMVNQPSGLERESQGLDSTEVVNQEAPLIHQEWCTDPPKVRNLDSPKVVDAYVDAYKEEEIHVQETHRRDSSSSAEPGPENVAADSTTTIAPLLEKSQNSTWTPELEQRAGVWLQQYLNVPPVRVWGVRTMSYFGKSWIVLRARMTSHSPRGISLVGVSHASGATVGSSLTPGAFPERQAQRRYGRQSDRWNAHYVRKRLEGMDDAFHNLEFEFACADSDRREETLAGLDAELSFPTAANPSQPASSRSPRPITQADVRNELVNGRHVA